MSNKLQEMYDGWKNNLTPQSRLAPHITRVANARQNICNTCEWSSQHPNARKSVLRPDWHCTNCGCTIAAKTKSLTSACPLGKWTAVVKDREIHDQ